MGKAKPLIILISNELLALGQPHIVWDIVPPAENTDRYHIRLIRAKALAAMGAPVDARSHLYSASRQPELTEADRFYLWQAARSTHFAEIELEFFQQFLAMKVTSTEDRLFLADIYLNNKKLPQAKKIIDRLFSNQPATLATTFATTFANSQEQVKALMTAARYANLSGDAIAAKNWLTEALALAPESIEILQRLIDYADNDQLAQLSQQYLDSASDIQSLPVLEQKDRLMAYAHIAEKVGQYAQAFDYYTQANHIEQARVQNNPKLAFSLKDETAHINRLIAAFPTLPTTTAQVTNEPCPIFIVGMPRSGSSLVERILGGLTGVHTSGENMTLSDVISQNNWDIKTRKAAEPMAKNSEDWQQMRSQYLALSYAKGCDFFTEKMPFNFYHVGHILAMLPDAPIVHMRRNPTDVCWSIFSRFFSAGRSYGVSLELTLREYELCERLMEHFKAIAPNRILTVDYQQFVHHPVAQGKRLAEFCRLPWNPTCLEFHVNDAANYTSSELQVRQAINTDGIGRWHKYQAWLGDFLKLVDESEVGGYRFG